MNGQGSQPLPIKIISLVFLDIDIFYPKGGNVVEKLRTYFNDFIYTREKITTEHLTCKPIAINPDAAFKQGDTLPADYAFFPASDVLICNGQSSEGSEDDKHILKVD